MPINPTLAAGSGSVMSARMTVTNTAKYNHACGAKPDGVVGVRLVKAATQIARAAVAKGELAG